MGIARNLLILRENKFMSIAEVANKVGVSRQSVNQWERGESAPTKKYLKVICELYGVTQSQLYSEDISKTVKTEELAVINNYAEVNELLRYKIMKLEEELAEYKKKKGA